MRTNYKLYRERLEWSLLSPSTLALMEKIYQKKYNQTPDLRDAWVNYCKTIINASYNSEPLFTVELSEQMAGIINDFINLYAPKEEENISYEVYDGAPASYKYKQGQTANEMLSSWSKDISRGYQFRDDTMSRDYPNHCNTEVGIQVYNYDHMNQNNHHNYFFGNDYYQMLNGVGLPHENVPFGHSTLASDARLLSRSITPIRRQPWEKWLYHRHHDYDMSENMPGPEYGTKLYGYNNDNIHRNIHERQIKMMTS